MWDLILMLVGMGMMIAFALVIAMIEMQRRAYPYTFISIEERQGNLTSEILKGKEVTDKKGVKQFFLFKTFLSSGLGALFQRKPILANLPDKTMAIVKKSGGGMIIALNPADNTYVPVSVRNNSGTIELISQDIDIRNWYKYSLEQTMRMKILRPATAWEKWQPALIIMAGILCLIIIVVGNQVISNNTAAISGQLASVADAVNGLSGNVGGAISGSNLIPPSAP